MVDITVPVPDQRTAEFYQFFGLWLAGSISLTATPGERILLTGVETHQTPVQHWADTEEDLALAQELWEKMTDRAKSMFELLMDEPRKAYTGEAIADALGIPNGRYGVAGVLAWPGRYCIKMGRHLPVRWDEASSTYWIEPEVASLFRKAQAT